MNCHYCRVETPCDRQNCVDLRTIGTNEDGLLLLVSRPDNDIMSIIVRLNYEPAVISTSSETQDQWQSVSEYRGA